LLPTQPSAHNFLSEPDASATVSFRAPSASSGTLFLLSGGCQSAGINIVPRELFFLSLRGLCLLCGNNDLILLKTITAKTQSTQRQTISNGMSVLFPC